MLSEVSILKCAEYSNEAVYIKVRELIGLLGGIKRFVKKGERILLKPNLLTGKHPDKAVTTHPAVVRALALVVMDAGGVPVIGDSPAIANAQKAAERCGIMDVASDLSVEFLELKTAVDVENQDGTAFKRLRLAQEALDCDGIINIPKLKTHAQMFLTLGVKNIFGCVPGVNKAQWHLAAGVDTSSFAGMLLDLFLYLKPRLTVIDAVVSMEGNGPANGTPKDTGFIAASADGVALDSAVVEILGAKLDDCPILKRAKAINAGVTDLFRIKILGESIEAVRVHGFRFPPLISANFAAGLPGFLDRRLRKALTSRPHIDHSLCTLCDVCIKVCPPNKMDKTARGGKIRKKNRITIDYDGCIRCFCCQEVCPSGAISAKEGWLKKIIPGL
ncbi:MAG: DUF362 domain-containing protein [Deltaproteobacteria bacterium]|nr:DUF362 domain-containing protein [Deltaproteobacteria bacterium]